MHFFSCHFSENVHRDEVQKQYPIVEFLIVNTLRSTRKIQHTKHNSIFLQNELTIQGDSLFTLVGTSSKDLKE